MIREDTAKGHVIWVQTKDPLYMFENGGTINTLKSSNNLHVLKRLSARHRYDEAATLLLFGFEFSPLATTTPLNPNAVMPSLLCPHIRIHGFWGPVWRILHKDGIFQGHLYN